MPAEYLVEHRPSGTALPYTVRDIVQGARCAVRSAAVRLHAVVDATHLGGGRVAQGMHNCGGEGGGGRKGWEGGRGEVGGGGKGARTRITSGGDPPRSSQRSRSGSTALECSMS